MAREAVDDRLARGEALQRLAVRFRSGADDKRLEAALEDVDRGRVATVDLEEAVQRIIAVHEKNTFPQSAVILRYCREAAEDRRRADFSSKETPTARTGRPPTTDEIDQCRMIRELGKRGVYFCDTCHNFRQAKKGANGTGWDPCHYNENYALWAAGTDPPITREQIHQGFEQFKNGTTEVIKFDRVEGFTSDRLWIYPSINGPSVVLCRLANRPVLANFSCIRSSSAASQ